MCSLQRTQGHLGRHWRWNRRKPVLEVEQRRLGIGVSMEQSVEGGSEIRVEENQVGALAHE